jgi:hypothetical protein
MAKSQTALYREKTKKLRVGQSYKRPGTKGGVPGTWTVKRIGPGKNGIKKTFSPAKKKKKAKNNPKPDRILSKRPPFSPSRIANALHGSDFMRPDPVAAERMMKANKEFYDNQKPSRAKRKVT